jgi:hypothetical protein
MDFEDQIKSPEALESALEPSPAEKAADHDADQEHDADHEGQKDGRSAGATDHGDGGLHDLRATAMKGTQHRKAKLSLGTQVGPDGKPTGAPPPHKEGKVADAARVSITASEKAPIELAPGAAPSEDQLFTRVASGGHSVTHRSGSPASPNVTPTMEENNLYIDGGPQKEDVRQGGLGDCFFHSCLLGITQNDPGKIQSVMSIAGNQVSVTLNRFDTKAGVHKPVTIKTGTGLLTKKNKKGISLVGARMRIGDAPKKTAWWAETHGKTVEVHRRDVYETALWAPMMEKAYADFAQTYGSEGHGKDKAEKKLGSGYKIINAGGSVENCYQMFYGGSVVTDQEGTSFTPGNNIVTDNIPAIQRLLTYEATKGNTAPGTTQGFMHARISETGAASRGVSLIDACKGLLFGEQFMDDFNGAIAPPSVMEDIARLLRTINRTALRNALDNLRTTLVAFGAGTVKANAVTKAAEPVIAPDVFPHLWNDSLPASFKHLRENLGILVNLGDDSSNKQRMNYAKHAYQVRTITMADSTGAAVALVAADLPAKAASIDPEKSTVEMHNPHATNEPDLRKTGPADGKDDGVFHYTLGQFLRNFDLLRLADVSH